MIFIAHSHPQSNCLCKMKWDLEITFLLFLKISVRAGNGANEEPEDAASFF